MTLKEGERSDGGKRGQVPGSASGEQDCGALAWCYHSSEIVGIKNRQSLQRIAEKK